MIRFLIIGTTKSLCERAKFLVFKRILIQRIKLLFNVQLNK